jgi:Mg/Co/Ni transporter MgtE
MIRAANLQERTVALQGCNAKMQQEVFGKMFAQNSTSFLGRATPAEMGRVWDVASFAEKEDMLKRLTASEKAELCAKAPVEVQVALLGRAPIQQRVSWLMGAMSNQEKALAFQQASPSEQVAMFERSGKEFYADALGRANVTQATYDNLDLQGKMDIVKQASVDEMAACFNRAELTQQDHLLNKMSIATKEQCLQRLTAANWTNLYGHLTAQDRADLVGRMPHITGQLLLRSDNVQKVGELYGRAIFAETAAH